MSPTQNATVYTTELCTYCHAEKAFLEHHGVAFTEVHVDADPAAAEEMISRSGQMGVPYTVVTGQGGETEVEIAGFDPDRLAKVFGI